MDQFDAFFRRADLDDDGRISGSEAVAFFQASNLPKPVLAQIWQHADQNRTGFLGRQEFYNALKLVTVAQSKRELTPDIVKAALYGPASAKIPAPQINLAALPPAQPNSMAPRPPTQQPNVMPPRPHTQQPNVSNLMGLRPPTQQPNTVGPRPPTQQPGVVNSMQPQNFGIRSQGPPSVTQSSPQYFAPQGNISIRAPSSSGPLPPQGVGNPSGSSLAGPVLSPSLMTPITSVGGNGVVSDPMFGGDVFSASQTLSKPMPAHTASNPPSASSAVVPLTSEPQAPVKIDPLGALNTFTRQPTPSVPRPSQQNGSSPNLSQPQWPKMTRVGVNKYMKVFMDVDTDRDGKITGEQARSLFLSWRLPREILKQVWDLSDQDNDSMLSLREFCISLYLMERHREGHNLPPTLPSNILLDETLLSLTGPPNPSYNKPPGWGATPGSVPPQQGMPGGQPMPQGGLRPPMPGMPPGGLRPPMPGMPPGGLRPGSQPMQYNQQRGPVPSTDTSHAHNLSNGDRSISRETTEAEKAVEDTKVILDSREKMSFYRNKMQDLVLYKSRCDNRLNEITERALADKREAELLAKKYEDKYKQVAEVASKLTIEEASFRDIQERKMELNQALVKMEQGGSADGILQVRADRIQSDLEELLKALAERCKKHGINVKSTAVIELPQGWQPGVPEISAVWDEDWDKFEDEGFQFDVAVPGAENSSPMDNFSQDSYSTADVKSEKPFENESIYIHSEDESPKSSPTTQKIFESPTKEDSFSHFGKNFDADTERSFDDQGWGTFDNNDDVDSVWGFNSDTTNKDEKHGESYFFDSNSFTASPRKSDSPQGGSSKKSPFGFDDSVPGSPASRAATSPRYSVGGAENSFFDNFSRYDSFNTTTDPKQETFSRFDSMSSTTQDNSFSRFDSMSTTTHDRSFARFDSMSSNAGFDHTFDDSDPFGSSGPFKVETGKKESDKWAF